MRKFLVGAAVGAALALSASVAVADDFREGIDDSPSAGAMAFDLLIVRPVGLVATVLGTGLFIVQLPLSLIQGEAPSAPAQKLVVEPAEFTFKRPLGVIE